MSIDIHSRQIVIFFKDNKDINFDRFYSKLAGENSPFYGSESNLKLPNFEGAPDDYPRVVLATQNNSLKCLSSKQKIQLIWEDSYLVNDDYVKYFSWFFDGIFDLLDNSKVERVGNIIEYTMKITDGYASALNDNFDFLRKDLNDYNFTLTYLDDVLVEEKKSRV